MNPTDHKQTDNQYIASDGTVLTDELIEKMAAEAENGFGNSTLEAVDGRPWETERAPMKNHAIRMPDALWQLIRHGAEQHGESTSEYARQALIRGIRPTTAQ